MSRSIGSAFSSLEILEARIAPAAITTFTENDGDIVKISTSKGTSTDLKTLIDAQNTHGKLELIDFSSDPATAVKFAGTSLTVAVTALGVHGNGIADVGYINATGISLGAVLIKGDLGKIVAGVNDTHNGVASLTVTSLGSRGTGSGAPDLVSTITGNLGPLKVFGHIEEASLSITGKLASATVSGSLVGNIEDNSGSITVAGASGPIKIGGDLEGGSGPNSGSLILSTTAKNSSVTINGDVTGGSGALSGSVRSGNLTSVFIGGNFSGGSVTSAGTLTTGTFTSITVSGDVFGGSAAGTGVILVGGAGGSITVGGSLIGGSAPNSGVIGETGFAPIGSITVKGSLASGTDHDTGEIGVNTVGTIFVGGNLSGGGAAAIDGGTIQVGNVTKSITIVGSLIGNTGAGGASVLFLNAPSLKIGGSVSGQLAAGSGAIKSLTLGSLEIGGSVDQSSILIGGADTADNATVTKTVHVGGSVSSSYLAFGSFERADVKVGAVQVDGNWTASDLVVGAVNLGVTNNVNFGDANDALAATGSADGTPTIASIAIEGTITGSLGGTDHYGFVAGKIGAFRAGSVKVPLKANAGNDQITIGNSGDVTIHEIGTAQAGVAPAPAALQGAAAKFTFTDTDGDTVRITSTKGTDVDLQNAATLAASGSGFQLQKLDLSATKNAQKFNGATVTISVTALGASGNGVVNVGEIDASGIALGAVSVKGDLGRITAGTLATKPALASLTVNSIGLLFSTTGAPDLHSTITGNLGPVKIYGDFNQAYLEVLGTLGATSIGGNLVGGNAASEGFIKAQGNAGAVRIGGSIFGGDGSFTGALDLHGKVASIFVGGDLVGSTGVNSGVISGGAAGAVGIGGTISAGSVAGTGSVTLASATSFAVGGNLSGGNASSTGYVQLLGKSGAVSVGGNITGHNGSGGYILAQGAITSFSVQGSIRDGSSTLSGTVLLQNATSIFVGGSIYGSGGATAATDIGGLKAEKVGTVTVNGSIVGGADGASGTLTVTSATSVKILGSVGGANVLTAGNLHATQSIGTLDIGGPVNGALILIGSSASAPGSMVAKSVHVGGYVNHSNFFFGSLDRADVKVGTATFDSDWFQSNLVVGGTNLGTDDVPGGVGTDADNVNFGDGHDLRAETGQNGVPSSIASIVVEGRIFGDGSATDHFGFLANKIGAFRAGGFAFPLHAGGAPDAVTFTVTGNVTVTESVPVP